MALRCNGVRLCSALWRRGTRWEQVAAWACGNGELGRLGLGPECKSEFTFQRMPLPKGHEDESLIFASAGGAHTAVVTASGTLLTAGLNDSGQLGHSQDERFVPWLRAVEDIEEPVSSVSSGYFHTLAVARSGVLYAFGSNRWSQLGIPMRRQKQVHPVRVADVERSVIRRAAAGARHSLVVSSDGTLFSWGWNGGNCLGHTSRRRLSLSQVEKSPRVVKGISASAIDAGEVHSAVVDSDGTIHAFGTDPAAVKPSQEGYWLLASDVSCGGRFTAALLTSGAIRLWGSNEHGALGSEEGTGPVDIGSHFNATQVSCGWKHAAAITRAGHLFSWGWGGSAGTFRDERDESGGQLGMGTSVDCPRPAQVPMSNNYTFVSCGFNHTIALAGEG